MGCSVVLLASAASALGGLVFGYELGIISGALLQLKRELSLSCVQQEALVSALLVGALLASVLGGCLVDRHGRRNSILLSNVLVLGGSVLLLLGSYWALVAGRVTAGFAICISSMSCCIYVSETVAAERRGFLVALYEAGVTAGILAAYAINYILSERPGGWRWMFGLAVLPALLQLVSIWFLPSDTEEPPGRGEPVGSVEAEESDEADVCSGSSSNTARSRPLYLCQRRDNMRTRTVLGLGLVLFQQFTGQPNILFYASTIFHSVGFQSDASAVLASVGLGVVKVLATATSMLVSDRVGRRPLLIGGCSVMAVSLVAIGLLSGQALSDARRPCQGSQNLAVTPHSPVGSPAGLGSLLHENRPLFKNSSQDEEEAGGRVQRGSLGDAGEPSPSSTWTNWAVLLCMMAVVSAFAVGFGPMTWLLLTEIFPAALRGRAFAFTSCFNWAAHLLVTSTFLNLIDAVGLSGVFLLYGLSAAAATVFFLVLLPETKGKSLEAIDRELSLKRFDHSWSFWSDENSSPQYRRVNYRVSSSE